MTAARPLLPRQAWPDWPCSIADLEDLNALPPEAYEYGGGFICDNDFYEQFSPPRAEGEAYVTERRVAGLTIDRKFIALKYSGDDFEIPRGRINSEGDLLRVVHQLTGKSWMDLARLRHFIERVAREVLGIEVKP